MEKSNALQFIYHSLSTNNLLKKNLLTILLLSFRGRLSIVKTFNKILAYKLH